MSDRMSTTTAQTYLEAWSTGDSVDMWKVRAARTIVAQAEQIERLQTALEHAMYYSAESISDLVLQGIILPGDMESPA